MLLAFYCRQWYKPLGYPTKCVCYMFSCNAALLFICNAALVHRFLLLAQLLQIGKQGQATKSMRGALCVHAQHLLHLVPHVWQHQQGLDYRSTHVTFGVQAMPVAMPAPDQRLVSVRLGRALAQSLC